MKICYIILTCEKYINTRVKWLRETCLFNVDQSDLYFLSCKPKEPNIYGWNTPDNYEGCPLKYIKFFQNMTLDYDWYFFMDDDTFIFTDRLRKYVDKFNANEPLYIGIRCQNYSFPIYMSGGAGFLLSKSLYNALIIHIRENQEQHLLQSIYGDLSVGLWLTHINKQIIIEEENVFNPIMYKKDDDLTKCISFHYLKTENDYQICKSLLEK